MFVLSPCTFHFSRISHSDSRTSLNRPSQADRLLVALPLQPLGLFQPLSKLAHPPRLDGPLPTFEGLLGLLHRLRDPGSSFEPVRLGFRRRRGCRFTLSDSVGLKGRGSEFLGGCRLACDQARFGSSADNRIWIGGKLVGEDLLATVPNLLRFVGQEVRSGDGGYDGHTLCSAGCICKATRGKA
jgi:hypothetical protein